MVGSSGRSAVGGSRAHAIRWRPRSATHDVHDETEIPDRTPRLTLRRMATADVDAPWPMLSDARMWTHPPESRHAVIAQTHGYVERSADRWSRDGVSYWAGELTDSGEVIGSGGVQVHPHGHWNLNYRIAVPHQGQGYASELVAAALTAAHLVGPERPCIAWIDEGNTPSRVVATRAGLTGPPRRLRRQRCAACLLRSPADGTDLPPRPVTPLVTHRSPGSGVAVTA